MHISVTQVMIIVALVAVTIVLTMGATPRQRRPETRPLARARISPTNAMIGGGALILGLCWMTLLNPYLDYRRYVSIREHGLRVQADVVEVYKSCHRGCDLHVRYTYRQVSSGSGPVSTGEGYLGELRSDDPHVGYAQRTGHVPVAVDVTRPQNSALNFDDAAFSTRREKDALSIMGVGGGFALIFSGMLLALLLTRNRRGRAAIA